MVMYAQICRRGIQEDDQRNAQAIHLRWIEYGIEISFLTSLVLTSIKQEKHKLVSD
jgi:hypothetical protein